MPASKNLHTSEHGSVALLREEERTVEKRVMGRLDWRAG
jgi:hypothetical protein